MEGATLDLNTLRRSVLGFTASNFKLQPSRPEQIPEHDLTTTNCTKHEWPGAFGIFMVVALSLQSS